MNINKNTESKQEREFIMADEKKTRRSTAEVKAEKKERYLKTIEYHKKAIADLEQKIVDLDRPPKKTEAQIRKAINNKTKDIPVDDLMNRVGITIDDLS